MDPQHPAVECLILLNKKPLQYNDVEKYLFLAPKGFHVFDCKNDARSAIWHTTQYNQANNILLTRDDYVIEPT